jgi:hypothetical protein
MWLDLVISAYVFSVSEFRGIVSCIVIPQASLVPDPGIEQHSRKPTPSQSGI